MQSQVVYMASMGQNLKMKKEVFQKASEKQEMIRAISLEVNKSLGIYFNQKSYMRNMEI